MKGFALIMMMLATLARHGMAEQVASTAASDVFGCPGDCNYDGRIDMRELRAAYRRALGMRNVLPSCMAAERHCDGETTIDDLVAAVDAAQRQCADTNGTPSGLVLGVYDASINVTSGDESLERSTLAAVDAVLAPFELRVRVGLVQSASIYGAFDGHDAICVEGLYLDSDIISPLRGRLQVEDLAEGRIVGSVVVDRTDRPLQRHLDLMLRHGASHPADYEGEYELAVTRLESGETKLSTMRLRLRDVDAQGFGSCGPVVELDQEGEPLAQVADGRCWVSPEGRVDYFSTEYLPADPQGCVAPLRLLGSLAAQSGASGEFLVGLVPPSCFEEATWTVRERRS